MEELTDNQPKNNPAKHLEKHQWKKGQSGNPAGRPKGKTMKEYAKELLACQTEEERQEFLHGLPKEVIWKMAEGNPATEANIGNKDGKPFIVNIVKEIAEQNEINGGPSENSPGQTPIQGGELREEIREDNPSD